MSGAPTMSSTVLARRCLCYLMTEMFSEALSDAMQAQVASLEWPIIPLLFTCGLSLEARDGS
ncbi:predicted protein [Arabidopsis lyrata subsp. lyrata]|uniref:Serine/threonine-protein kinase BSK n=1 Tax=Arabidopsis lyrata subsp. lyrata TaxID=81972 RepID=D7KJ17_ARALL|nr:predicted protein [Arabidopsis lyrata subsp. lyrata]